ncbi:unnamed protein product [marine sediment metagenome]|uniref:Uncharacterized protein n=1 Tax=marine sediment metagenome TaxID=412755 RepID=X1JW35_9ZZZZ
MAVNIIGFKKNSINVKEKVEIITADILLKCSLPLFVITPLKIVSSENDKLN